MVFNNSNESLSPTHRTKKVPFQCEYSSLSQMWGLGERATFGDDVMAPCEISTPNNQKNKTGNGKLRKCIVSVSQETHCLFKHKSVNTKK